MVNVKKILLFGAGKSATVLIDYLIHNATVNKWEIIIADVNRDQILAKTNNAPCVTAIQVDINNANQRGELIADASIVISMMPPALHFLIAGDCVAFGKNLLTASYVDPSIKQLEKEIKEKKLLFLCEMGLDPGIDHMSAMKILDGIKQDGGNIKSFKSHCGGLVAPESDDNPWHYKISWNPRNVVMAGKAGAEYKLENKIHQLGYENLFKNCDEVNLESVGTLACYPNRDSLSYMPIYHLDHVDTFLRTTLRYPSFCIGWNAIAQSGLTDDLIPVTEGISFKEWSKPVLKFMNEKNEQLLQFLGLFDEHPIPPHTKTSADVLQYLLETKLAMKPTDKDMIIMFHEIEYEKNGVHKKIESSLVVKGEDSMRTAMAKTVGLPLGIAAKLILNGTIQLEGIHIPTEKEIYEPVLKELEIAGIYFNEKETTF